MARRQTTASVLFMLAGLLSPATAAGQDCAGTVSPQCAAFAKKLATGACIKPGSVFVLKDKWESALRAKIVFNNQRRVHFFYVVDGTNIAAKYDAIFVGIDRVGLQSTHSDVKLTQNRAFKFKSFEDKRKYSRALKPGGQPTQPMRQWSDLPDLGNIFLLKDADVISAFDIPQAIDDANHAPHARLYRFEAGSISCVPFSAGLNSDVDIILGRVIDSSKPEPIFFRVTVE